MREICEDKEKKIEMRNVRLGRKEGRGRTLVGDDERLELKS